ncbi:hypothetical protein [Arthrobacter sp. SLBN-112]|uniref:hypothetical protein n=1 Tax=Arthrobacter sp. SLBN-112 TaxID=2768452 RepID=UPI0027AFBFE7|nr:hypothetical protein [Arthrobacter sp. SLBN-112]MDQ0799382.1 hypothetical protein [Arthrobacter sp. SLBN-112]
MSHEPHLSVTSVAFPLMGGDNFPSRPLPLSLEVTTVEEPWRRDEKLCRAVNVLIPFALEHKQGILVIQRDYGKYIVRVDQEVPCGVTHETRHQNLQKGKS